MVSGAWSLSVPDGLAGVESIEAWAAVAVAVQWPRGVSTVGAAQSAAILPAALGVQMGVRPRWSRIWVNWKIEGGSFGRVVGRRAVRIRSRLPPTITVGRAPCGNGPLACGILSFLDARVCDVCPRCAPRSISCRILHMLPAIGSSATLLSTRRILTYVDPPRGRVPIID